MANPCHLQRVRTRLGPFRENPKVAGATLYVVVECRARWDLRPTMDVPKRARADVSGLNHPEYAVEASEAPGVVRARRFERRRTQALSGRYPHPSV